MVKISQLGDRCLFWITSDCGAGGGRESMPVFLFLEMLHLNLRITFSFCTNASFTLSGLWFCLFLCFVLKKLLWNGICWREEVFFLCLLSPYRTPVDHKKIIQIGICASSPHMKMCVFKRLEPQDLIPYKVNMDDWQRQSTLTTILFSDIGPDKSETAHGWLYIFISVHCFKHFYLL